MFCGGTVGYCRLLLGTAGYYWVLLGTTGYWRVRMGTGLHLELLGVRLIIFIPFCGLRISI